MDVNFWFCAALSGSDGFRSRHRSWFFACLVSSLRLVPHSFVSQWFRFAHFAAFMHGTTQCQSKRVAMKQARTVPRPTCAANDFRATNTLYVIKCAYKILRRNPSSSSPPARPARRSPGRLPSRLPRRTPHPASFHRLRCHHRLEEMLIGAWIHHDRDHHRRGHRGGLGVGTGPPGLRRTAGYCSSPLARDENAAVIHMRVGLVGQHRKASTRLNALLINQKTTKGAKAHK